MEIRSATLNDLKQLDEFQQELGEYERGWGNLTHEGPVHYWTKKELEKNIKAGLVFLAYEDDQVVGCVMCEIKQVTGDWCKYDRQGMIHLLFMREAYRGKGFGTALLEHAISVLKEKNIKWIGIQALAKNTAALELYRKLGFSDLMVELRL